MPTRIAGTGWSTAGSVERDIEGKLRFRFFREVAEAYRRTREEGRSGKEESEL
jgi:hypothetical protein